MEYLSIFGRAQTSPTNREDEDTRRDDEDASRQNEDAGLVDTVSSCYLIDFFTIYATESVALAIHSAQLFCFTFVIEIDNYFDAVTFE